MAQLNLSSSSLQLSKRLRYRIQWHVRIVMPSRNRDELLKHIGNNGSVGSLNERLRLSLPQAGHSDLDIRSRNLGVDGDNTGIRVRLGPRNDVIGGSIKPGIAKRGHAGDGDGKVDDSDFSPSERKSVGIEIKTGDDTEVVSATAESLIKIFILGLGSVGDGSIGEDNLNITPS